MKSEGNGRPLLHSDGSAAVGLSLVLTSLCGMLKADRGLHKMIDPSVEADAMWLPSGLTAIDQTGPLCPRSSPSCRGGAFASTSFVAHIRKTPSSLAETR